MVPSKNEDGEYAPVREEATPRCPSKLLDCADALPIELDAFLSSSPALCEAVYCI